MSNKKRLWVAEVNPFVDVKCSLKLYLSLDKVYWQDVFYLVGPSYVYTHT